MKLKRLITTILCVCMLGGAVPALAIEKTDNLNESLFIEDVQLATLKAELQETEEKMEHAHTMAASARELGLEEDSETISLAKEYWAEAHSKREELTSLLNEYQVFHYLSYNVFERTNISVKGFNILLENTPLAGQGQSFEDMEKEWGVNGLFALSVAKTESGLGTSSLAINKNNYFGMIGCSFSSPHNGIMYFGELMNKGYYKNKDIEAIARTYCPPTWSEWASQNRMFMRDFWERLMRLSPEA